MANFKKDLQRGQAGEAMLRDRLGLVRLDGRGADLVCPSSGLLYEIKTDFYSPWKYPNFFMEHISVDSTGALGGPFQAQQKGIGKFVYYFINSGFAYEFDTNQVVAALNSRSWGDPTVVKNTTYNTIGYRVNRKKLLSMLEDVKLIILEEAHEE